MISTLHKDPPMNAHHDPRALAIIREARHYFVSEGYAGTRIEPIAREACVSTATLYMLFDSKASLFEAVIKDAANDFSKKLEALKVEGKPSRQLITDILVSYTEFLADPFVRQMFRLVLSERPRFSDLVSDFFDIGRGNIAHILIAVMDQLAEEGLVRFEKASWAISQLLGMVEHSVLLLPLATNRDPVMSRSCKVLAEDAVETFWARYGT